MAAVPHGYTKIFWTEPEYIQVCIEYERIKLLNEYQSNAPALLGRAQQVLPESRRRLITASSTASSIVTAFRKLKAAGKIPTIPIVRKTQPFNTLPKPPEPAPILPPTPPVIISQQPSLFDGMLQAFVTTVVTPSVKTLLAEQEARFVMLLSEQQDRFEKNLNFVLAQQYDRLMAYWDSDAEPTQNDVITPLITFNEAFNRKNSIKPVIRKIIIVGGEAPMFNLIKERLPKDWIVQHQDGRNPRSLTLGGSFDLVVCTKFCGHSSAEVLKKAYGDRFVFAPEGVKNIVSRILVMLGEIPLDPPSVAA